MADSSQISPGRKVSTVGRGVARRPSSRTSLRMTIRFGVDALFRFKYRSTRSNALWCQTQRVWLGQKTFIHWALCDNEMEIARAAARAADAPQNAAELQQAIREELGAYWTVLLASLPRTTQPFWLPLP